ncbi:MAG: discoidin domain-containing protein [Muribaculaceae bacterium]|nr:discoidin domain-containing protein [Muribaculaceae bacterium]
MKHSLLLIGMVLLGIVGRAQTLNRPIGQYPGDLDEYYGPTLVTANDYRNVALFRPVQQSSSWDYNLTAHLLTDGITDKRQPAWLNVTTNQGEVPPHKREAAIDGNEWTCNILMGDNVWLQYDWSGMSIDIDELEVVCSMAYREGEVNGFKLQLLTSQDGNYWTIADRWIGDSLPGEPSRRRVNSDPNKNSDDDLLPTRNINHTFHLSSKPVSHIRLELFTPGAVHWTITELKMHKDGKPATSILPATNFISAWRSLGSENEWVSVDLGTAATIDKLLLQWIGSAPPCTIQLSNDGNNWETIATQVEGYTLNLDPEMESLNHVEEIKLYGSATGRISRSWSGGYTEVINFPPTTAHYVRINMIGKKAPYAMSELEVYGTRGLTLLPHTEGGWQDGKWLLNGGDWNLRRASHPSSPALKATVPATVLSSFVNAGALPDMNHDDNLMQASESYFNGDFIYTRQFDLPNEMKGKRVFLNLDGINWKAEVKLNGTAIGRIEGAFKRGKFDITPYLKGKNNKLEIKIFANSHPGGVKVKTEKNTDYNGGILGADNPTFHATIGWDWISTIRGRDIGIWDDVYLTASGDVTVSDPVVTTRLGENDTLATMTPAVVLTNHSDETVTGTLQGYIGDIHFEREVTLPPGRTIEQAFYPTDYPQLKKQRMRLWWPNGYGEPYLYDAGFSFIVNGALSDSVKYKAGIREVKTTEKDTWLRIFINNRRLIPKGGNWAFSENNLNYRGREFDAAVRHHREMNYNMIRNWVGMTGDKEFYEACDRYGLMVWQDFWLANPADGPDPDDKEMFMDNARDMVLKIRNHPCIGIYCGRNEGYPPKTLDEGLRNTVAALHPGLDYISSSADDGVSGHGPYWALSPKEYFEKQTGKLHTERGMLNVMTYEGLSRTLAPEHLWPQNLYWGRHDYTMEGAQRGASFNQLITYDFGEPTSAEEFCEWAQWINYEGYRAMYEGGNKNAMGLLIWMSHPCWPSMVWQTYDYYLEPTAAYFGVKHACEPLHVQWNPITNQVEVINHSAGHQKGTVTAIIYGMNGDLLWERSMPYDLQEDKYFDAMTIEVPRHFEGVYFLRLTLTNNNGKQMSLNDYVQSTFGTDRAPLHDLRRAQLETVVSKHTVTLTNTGDVPAVMLRLNLKGSDGEQILPVIYSDNYFHLMPGESRTINVEWKAEDARGLKPVLEITGMNY